jgi:Fe-S cluster biogenesis protein NfuA
LLDGARLELRELKARPTLLGACTSCPVLRSDLEVVAIEIKDLKHKLDHSSRYIVLSPPCETCVSLKGKLLHAIKENTELQQEVAYLTVRLDKTALSEKMIEEDLSRVEESTTKSTYRLSVEFEICEKKGEKSASKFVPSSSYHKEEKALKSTKTHYPSNPKPYVTFGDDKKGKVLGTGVIKVNDCFTLNDVALVDRLRYNLLSISRLCDADLSVLFRKSDSHVPDSSGKRVYGISRIGNVF